MEPSRSSAVPLNSNTGAGVAGGGEQPYDEGMEHRMTALETRFDRNVSMDLKHLVKSVRV
jgi:hypothetical protein